MNQLVRANVVAYRRRYAAVISAIAIGVAFLTATLFVGGSVNATLAASVGQGYQNAQFVVQPNTWKMDDGERETPSESAIVSAIAQQKGISSTLSSSSTMSVAELAGGTRENVFVAALDGDASLFGQALTSGADPGNGEATLNESAAAKAGLSIGDSITMEVSHDNGSTSEQRLKITGLREDSQSPQTSGFPTLQVNKATAASLNLHPTVDLVLARLGANVDTATLSADVDSSLSKLGLSDPFSGTPAQAVTSDVADLSGGTDVLTWVLGAFAGIALVVTVLVVSNTFAVILAQRIRELALLRTLGARRSQIRRMVLGESLAVGVIGGIIGALAGTLVVWGGIAILARALALPYLRFGFSVWPVVIGILVGLLVTVLASLRPALAATKVSPLAALRPQATVTARSSQGTTRIVIGLLLVVAGAAALYCGAAGVVGDDLQSFAAAFLGGLLSFTGVLMLGTLLIPWSVRQLARPFGAQVAGRLSGLNALRHPQRTSAIGTALLLGVTLVSLMLVGATSARSTLNAELAHQYPIDLAVRGSDANGSTSMSQDTARAVSEVDGVADAALVPVVATSPQCRQIDRDSSNMATCFPVYGADRDVLKGAMTTGLALPRDGSIAVGQNAVNKGETEVTIVDGAGKKHVLPIDPNAAAPEYSFLVTGTTLKELGDTPLAAGVTKYSGGSAIWIRASQTADVNTLVGNVAKAAKVDASHVWGAMPVRQMFSQIIDTLLMIVSALLAVAVVIALIGVSNTLSLSVIERTRENSLLRALGLTKRQLRRMLALEAGLIAAAASLLGLVLGSIYGIAGAKSATLALGGFVVSLPWLWLGVVLLVSVGAAVLASVWPARRAARLSPVEGLAVE